MSKIKVKYNWDEDANRVRQIVYKALKDAGKDKEAEMLGRKIPMYRNEWSDEEKALFEKYPNDWDLLKHFADLKKIIPDVGEWKKPTMKIVEGEHDHELLNKVCAYLDAIHPYITHLFLKEYRAEIFDKKLDDRTYTYIQVMEKYVIFEVKSKTELKCKATTSKGTRCSIDAVWDDYCTRHHPDKRQIPPFARKKLRYWTKSDRLSRDRYYLDDLINAKNEEDLLERWMIFKQEYEYESLYDEIVQWRENVEEYFPGSIKEDELNDCELNLENIKEAVEEIEKRIKQKADDISFEDKLELIGEQLELIESESDGIVFPSAF